jgi:hypothetical protein
MKVIWHDDISEEFKSMFPSIIIKISNEHLANIAISKQRQVVVDVCCHEMDMAWDIVFG